MSREKMTKRPIGVIILSALHILGGLAMIAGLAASLGGKADAPFHGGTLFYMSGMLVLLAGINLGAGAGLLMGRKWGWCLSFFFLVLLTLRNVEGLLLVPVFAQFRPSQEINAAYSSYGIALVVQGLLMVYYFKSNVMEYFGLDASSKPRLVVWSVTAVLVYLTLNLVLDLKLAAPAGHG